MKRKHPTTTNLNAFDAVVSDDLTFAALAGNLHSVRDLLRNKGAHVIVPKSLFWEVAVKGNVDVLKCLVEHNGVYATSIFVESNGEVVESCIISAIYRCQKQHSTTTRLVMYMVDHLGADVNSQLDPVGFTALMVASHLGLFEVVRYLVLCAGAFIDQKWSKASVGEQNYTALTCAVDSEYGDCTRVLSFLVKSGARMDFSRDRKRRMSFARNMDISMFKIRFMVCKLYKRHQFIRDALKYTSMSADIRDTVEAYLQLLPHAEGHDRDRLPGSAQELEKYMSIE